jgi:hypothetical protein
MEGIQDVRNVRDERKDSGWIEKNSDSESKETSVS